MPLNKEDKLLKIKEFLKKEDIENYVFVGETADRKLLVEPDNTANGTLVYIGILIRKIAKSQDISVEELLKRLTLSMLAVEMLFNSIDKAFKEMEEKPDGREKTNPKGETN